MSFLHLIHHWTSLGRKAVGNLYKIISMTWQAGIKMGRLTPSGGFNVSYLTHSDTNTCQVASVKTWQKRPSHSVNHLSVWVSRTVECEDEWVEVGSDGAVILAEAARGSQQNAATNQIIFLTGSWFPLRDDANSCHLTLST